MCNRYNLIYFVYSVDGSKNNDILCIQLQFLLFKLVFCKVYKASLGWKTHTVKIFFLRSQSFLLTVHFLKNLVNCYTVVVAEFTLQKPCFHVSQISLRNTQELKKAAPDRHPITIQCNWMSVNQKTCQSTQSCNDQKNN